MLLFVLLFTMVNVYADEENLSDIAIALQVSENIKEDRDYFELEIPVEIETLTRATKVLATVKFSFTRDSGYDNVYDIRITVDATESTASFNAISGDFKVKDTGLIWGKTLFEKYLNFNEKYYDFPLPFGKTTHFTGDVGRILLEKGDGIKIEFTNAKIYFHLYGWISLQPIIIN